MTRLCLILLLFLHIIPLAFAQPVFAQDEAGQFCVRAYEDRDADSIYDIGEPVITRGIGANLLNEGGVVIQSALLDSSPTSAQGVICFLNLLPGQYTMTITSADYQETTLDNMTVNIGADTLTTLFEFGATRVNTLTVTQQPEDLEDRLDEATVERLAVATVGALAAMVGAALIGLILTFFIRRNLRRRQTQDARRATTTGGYPTVQDTGEYRRR